MSISNQKGDEGEAAFVLAAVKKGYWTGKMPQDCPYDFVLDRKDGKILRVQVKYRALLEQGTIKIKLAQNHHSNRQNYTSKNVDVLAVYVPDLNQIFLVPINEIDNVDEVTLRCIPSKSTQTKVMRMIDPYVEW
jgi:hypothetical protein